MKCLKKIPETKSYNISGLFSLMARACVGDADPTQSLTNILDSSLKKNIPVQAVDTIYAAKKSIDTAMNWLNKFPNDFDFSALLGVPAEKLNKFDFTLSLLKSLSASPNDVANWISLTKSDNLDGWGNKVLITCSKELLPLDLVIKQLMNSSPDERKQYLDADSSENIKLTITSRAKSGLAKLKFPDWEQLFLQGTQTHDL